MVMVRVKERELGLRTNSRVNISPAESGVEFFLLCGASFVSDAFRFFVSYK
jgi:hypothetical protein